MSVETRLAIFDLARDLAEAIEESEELYTFRVTEDAVLADDEALALIREYEVARRALAKAKKAPLQEQMLLGERFMGIEAQFQNHPIIQAYWTARTEMDAYMERINAIVTFPITGDDTPKVRSSSGGGSCGT
jgi:cell fate (sporulation/competence/biofilm development) regulator YlbF (YheA/YmcA/DUF963 family)